MTRAPRTPVDALLTEIRSCLEAAAGHPGLVKASVYQSEGYLRGVQGLAWERRAPPPSSKPDVVDAFLRDVRGGSVALRGRLKKRSDECLAAFESGFFRAYEGSKGKPFAAAISKLWVRWLAQAPLTDDPFDFSREAGRKVGRRLKTEYEEGVAGNLAAFVLDKRLHLDGVVDFLRMRGWLLGTIEHLRRDGDAEERELAAVLEANLSSIVLRAQHNGRPDYAAEAVGRLSSLTKDLDRAIANLAGAEPETSLYLRNNRSTIIARALHSGIFDYGDQVIESLPSALKGLEERIRTLADISPEKAGALRANKRTVVYRALTNGRLDALLKKG